MSFRFIALSLLLLNSCSTLNTVYHESHQLAQFAGIAPLNQVERNSRWVLPRDSSFYVAKNNDLAAMSIDGAAGLSQLVEQAITDHFSAVRGGLYPESLNNSLASAKMAGSQFVIYPKLLVWDDKLGTWAEIFYSLRNHSNQQIVAGFGLDRAAVQIIILDVASGDLVDFVQVEAGSGLFSLYGDQPANLILPTLSDYFSKLAMSSG
ncbi:MAG: DUF4823 domain-containing protein [Pseudomonadales bacterium]|nr:DUF4823 domain-containing protein [Pseudomonadales bacterium]